MYEHPRLGGKGYGKQDDQGKGEYYRQRGYGVGADRGGAVRPRQTSAERRLQADMEKYGEMVMEVKYGEGFVNKFKLWGAREINLLIPPKVMNFQEAEEDLVTLFVEGFSFDMPE